MGVRIVVAVTDTDWFEHLRAIPDLEEVNFWSPGAAPFRALSFGELLLFKLHAPNNFIVGGGIFVHANILPVSLAWEAFGHRNGAGTHQEMRARIAKYHRGRRDDRSDFPIGCRILAEPFFFSREQWIPMLESWKPQTVNYKIYSTDERDGRILWDAVQAEIAGSPAAGVREERARYGGPYQVEPRLGQGAFRILVTDSYERRCAVTRERTLPALDAAHIVPYSEGGTHEASNGILLRRDIHCLFDRGYVTVTPDMHFEVSPKIKEEFENGRDYYALHGKQIAVPEDPKLKPRLSSLEWHNHSRFLT